MLEEHKMPNQDVMNRCINSLTKSNNAVADILRNISPTAVYQMDATTSVQSAPYLPTVGPAPSQGSTALTSTTKFVDASEVRQTENDNNENDLGIVDELHSIRKILKRPVLIKEFALSSGTSSLTNFGPQVQLFGTNLPQAIIDLGNKKSKIANFTFLRCKSMMRIQLNAMPFTSGKLWICFAPYDNQMLSRNRINNKGLAGVTSYPGVEMDLAKTNAVTLEVPWCQVEEARYTWETMNAAAFKIFAMTPIRGPAGFNATIQVFGWLESVDLKGPTYRLPPAAPAATYQMDEIRDADTDDDVESDVQGKVRRPQANFTERNKERLAQDWAQHREEMEQEKPDDKNIFQRAKEGLRKMGGWREAPGPIEKIAGYTSRLTRVNIPYLSQMLKPVTWVSDIVGLAANVMGWSRPVDGATATAISNIPGRGMAQTTCPDQAVVLGFDNQNEIAASGNVFLREEDEMSLNFIAQRPGLIMVSPFTKTNKAGDVIAKFRVGMCTDWERVTETTSDRTVYPTCIEAAARLYSHWRSDFGYRISVAKTPFHTGRLEIVFVPGYYSEADPANFDATNCYRTIMDLSRQNETTVLIPYLSKYEMLQMSNVKEGETNVLGYLIVRALTPLICPDTVANTVDVCTWKWASNVAFAGTTYANAALPASYQMDVGTDQRVDQLLVYNSESPKDATVEVAQRVCGEMAISLRPLTRAHRYYGTLRLSPPQLSEARLFPLTSVVANGFYQGVEGNDIGECVDYLSRISDLYAYFKGGLSYKIFQGYTQSSTTQEFPNAILPRFTAEVKSVLTRRLMDGNHFDDNYIAPDRAAFHITRTDLTNVHEVMVPFYSGTRKQPCNVPPTVNHNLVMPGVALPEEVVVAAYIDGGVFNEQTVMAAYSVYRAGKDDFTFGCLIGPPKIVEPLHSA